jgi:hypothetical protein
MPLLTEDQLKQVLHGVHLSQKDRVLLLLAACDAPQRIASIRSLGRSVGLREIVKWNLADILGKSGGMAISTDKGWELHVSGREHVRSLASTLKINLVVTTSSHSLRQRLTKIGASTTKSFVEEAIICFEALQYRAAVVFAWCGAMSLLYDRVVATQLQPFNTEATRRDPTWRNARNSDDLTRMKEHDFLDVIESLGVIGRNVKQTLQAHCLQLRNSCGHPNSLQIGENSAAAHIEKLILNVYSKF